MSVFPFKTFFLVVVAVAIAGGILGFTSVKGGGSLKKQWVAWCITGVMVLCAIGIGYAKAPVNNPAHSPDYPMETIPPAASSFVWDNARVLSVQTVRELDERNEKLWERYKATIGVITCNYGGDDLYDYALQCAGDMGLGGYDMIVALDISGDNYWLVQGDDIRRDFTDDDCADYAYEYMERSFARGDYDTAVLDLTFSLAVWYANYYGYVD